MKETHQGFLSRSIPARRRRSLRGRLRTKKEDTQMRVFLFGAGGRTRTGTPSLAVDFESTTSTNSITPALLSVIIQHGARKFKKKLPEAALFLRFHLLVEVFAEQGERGGHV